MGILKDLLNTLKWGISMFRTRKSDLINSTQAVGIAALIILIVVSISGNYLGLVDSIEVLKLTVISLLLGFVDAATLTTVAYILDPLIGDVFGVFGLRAVLSGLALFALPKWMYNYLRGIR
jgi:hypothetical protein